MQPDSPTDSKEQTLIAQSCDASVASARLQTLDTMEQLLIEMDNSQRIDHFDLFIAEFHRLSAWPSILSNQDMFLSRDPGCEINLHLLPVAAEAAFCLSLFDKSKEILRKILIVRPSFDHALSLYRQVCEWEAYCEMREVSGGIFAGEEELYLQMLGYHHFESFFQLYTDEISQLCRLPYFHDYDDWANWLSCKFEDAGEYMFAITHQSWGVVGQIGLVLEGDSAFFYYWVGEEFQGRGIGTTAARIMLREAQSRWGIRTFHAKVFDYNTRSQGLLARLGFMKLNVMAAIPFHDEVHFCKGSGQNHFSQLQVLERFYAAIGCPRQLMYTSEHH